MIAKHLVHMHGSRRSSAWPHNFFKSFPLVCRRAFQIFSLFHWFAGVHSNFWEPLPYCIGCQSGASSTLLHYFLTFSDKANVGCHICECWCDGKHVLVFITTEIIFWKVLEGCPFDINQWAKFTYFPSIFCRVRIIDIRQLWIFQLWRQVVLHTTRGLGTCHGARLDVSGRVALGFASLLVAKQALMQNPLGIWQS